MKPLLSSVLLIATATVFTACDSGNNSQANTGNYNSASPNENALADGQAPENAIESLRDNAQEVMDNMAQDSYQSVEQAEYNVDEMHNTATATAEELKAEAEQAEPMLDDKLSQLEDEIGVN
ncbi:MAG: hypothetical protein KTR20_03935 [Cellvibrionaceae bacterium]|nr:hypothetical protein [Cellvibrionaceae bacterium]